MLKQMFIIVFIVVVMVFLFYWIFSLHNCNDAKTDYETFSKFKHNTLIDQYDINNSNQLYEKKFNNIPIYYINLNRSYNRRNFMENQFDLYNIPFTRIEAVDGKKLSLKDGFIDDRFNYKTNYTIKNIYELACTLSHLKTILTSYQNGDEWALILEDDASISLCPFWEKTIIDIIDSAPANWNIISLFTYTEQCHAKKKKYIPFNKTWCNSALAYIINRKGMENILKGVYEEKDNNYTFILDKNDKKNKKNNEDIVADIFIYKRSNNMYTYNDVPLIFAHNPKEMDSTIHPSHTNYHQKMTYNLFNNKN